MIRQLPYNLTLVGYGPVKRPKAKKRKKKEKITLLSIDLTLLNVNFDISTPDLAVK